MLKELTEEIEYGLERVSAAVKRGELKLDGDKVKVRWLAAQRTPPELKEVRRNLYRAYLRAQFSDLIMAVDAETHFSAEILGRPAENETELLHLYAGIVGQSMARAPCNAPSIPGARRQAAKSMPRFSDSFRRRALDTSISTA